MRRIALFLLAALALIGPGPASANIQLGDPVPNITKARLGGGTIALNDYLGKVVVLFLFGYNCPVCLSQCGNFETQIQQYYAGVAPGQVQVLGSDSWNGTVAQVTDFRDQTGATFPLMLNGSSSTGGNTDLLLGPWDNYLVINKQGIVRYHAANVWPHGNRQHIDEIRGAVDSLIAGTVSVEPTPSAVEELRVSASPNPFRDRLRVDLSLARAASRARLDLHDVTGRRIATLHDAPLPAGVSRIEWRPADGATLAPGLYLIAADIDGRRVRHRVVKLP